MIIITKNKKAMHDLDILFINPPSRLEVYQKLAGKYAAIEPPTWALLLAQSVRSDGYNVKIMDSNAENLDEKEITKRIAELNPKIICFVVYGQNVNAGTTNMSGATYVSNYLKKK